MSNQTLLWVVFNIFVFGMLALDLGLFHRKAHEIKIKEALIWSAVWIVVAIIFNFGVYYYLGSDAALKFLTGYVLERSLSVDNLFVFLLIFSYFRVPAAYQHKVLFWGIIGALLMRALFIVTGITLIEKFHFTIYVFGAFLIYTGIKMAIEKDSEINPEHNPVLKLFRRFIPVTSNYEGSKFFTKSKGRNMATPLFIVLIVVETTDVIFAVDSIPAILAITTDSFIVYSSNIFAILGLRALYFALAGIMQIFHYLNYGLSIVLVFVGVKMLLSETQYKIPLPLALGIIGGVLALSVIASIIWPRKELSSIPPSAMESLDEESDRQNKAVGDQRSLGD
jgi:tellurite resistance protein TerC